MSGGSDSVTTIEKLAEACVLFALAAGGGSALRDESQTEFFRRVAKVLEGIRSHAVDKDPQKGRGRKKLASTHIQYAVKKLVERGLVKVVPQKPADRKHAINLLTLSATGWRDIQSVSKNFQDIVHLMPEPWQEYTLPQTLFTATDVEALGEAVRTILREEEVIKTLLSMRHELNTLAKNVERMEERIRNTPRPSGTALLAEVFSSLAAMFNPSSKT